MTGLDIAADVRDVLYDITNWKPTKEHILQTVLDGVGLIPVIGAFKNIDEAADLLKHGDELVESVGDAAKRAGKLNIDDAQFGKKIGKHAQDYGLNPKNTNVRNFLKDKINNIFGNPTEIRQGEWRGLGQKLPNGSNASGEAKFYIQDNDVIVTDLNGDFVTIMKDGINNPRVIEARTIWHNGGAK